MSGRAVIKASQMGEEMQSQAVRVAQDGMGLCNTENVRGRRARALGGRARRRAQTRVDTRACTLTLTLSQEIAGHIKKSFQDAYACVRARPRPSTPIPQGVARSLASPRSLDTPQGQLARLLRPQRGLVRDARGGQVHLLLSRPDRFHHLRDGMIERPERASVVRGPS